MIKRIKSDIEEIFPRIRDLRREIHRYPELRMKEFKTAKTVEEELIDLNMEVYPGYAGTTAVIGRIMGEKPGPVRAFRADMDALPIKEETGLPYASEREGLMHACGHDFNTAILLGLAHILNKEKKELQGNVVFVFQPGEEGGFGGKILTESGFIEKFEIGYIVALHLFPDIVPGKVGYKTGMMTANADGFTITIKGKGAHGARPDRGVDPIVIAAHIVVSLSTIRSREISALEPTVITVGSIHSGTTSNVIPDTAVMVGTIRTFGEENRKFVAERIRAVAEGIASSFRAKADVKIGLGYPSVINDASITNKLKKAGELFLGKEKVVDLGKPTMGGEDFAYYLKKIPGTFYRLGVGSQCTLHNAKFAPDEKVLKIGMGVNATLALLLP